MNWDPENCGGRDIVCEAGRTCEAGICVGEDLAVARAAEAARRGDGPVALLASATWTNRTPGVAVPADGIGGRLTGVAPDLGDSTRARIFVGSPGGGFWRRDTEAGNWYQPTTSGGADHTIMHLEWDYDWTAMPRRLWRANWNGLQYSTSLGGSWIGAVNSGAGPSQALLPQDTTGIVVRDPRPFAQLRFSTTSSQRAVFFSYGCQGIYYSFGTTFMRFWPFEPQNENNPQNCIGSIAADPATLQVFFTSLYGGPGLPNLVYRTGPWEWNMANTTVSAANGSLPTGGRMVALVAAPQPVVPPPPPPMPPVTNRMLATTISAGNTDHWVTTNSGGTWTKLTKSISGQRQPRALPWGGIDDRGCYTNATGSDPMCKVTAPTTAFDEVFQGNVQSWHSLDFGASWLPPTASPGTLLWADNSAVMLDPRATARRAYFTFDHTGWPRTSANLAFANWTPGSAMVDRTRIDVPGMATNEAHFVGLLPPPLATKTLARRVHLGAQEAAVISYANAVSGSPASCITMTNESQIYQFAQTPSTLRVYWGDNGSLARWSGSPGQDPCAFGVGSWLDPVSPPGYVYGIDALRNRLAIRPGTIDEIYYSTFTQIRKSTDGGVMWPTVLVPPITSPVLTAVHVPASGDVYVGTRGAGVWRYNLAFLTWERLTPVPATTCPTTACAGSFVCGWDSRCHPASVSAIATMVSGGTTTVFMATSTGLYRKVGAAAASVVAGGGGYWTSDVAVDCGGRVYVAFGFAETQARHRGGIQISTTGGGAGSWTSITTGLGIHEAPVTDVEVDPYDARYVYAASYGHGYWIYDHGMPLTCP